MGTAFFSRIFTRWRSVTAVALVLAFNAAAVAWAARQGLPLTPAAFAVWFAGDATLGLVALWLTECPSTR